MLTPVRPEGSEYRLVYEGPVGVSGEEVQQTLDLTLLPEYVLRTKFFRDSWRVFIQPLDGGVSYVSSDFDFSADNKEMVFTLDSSSPDAGVKIEAWFISSLIR